MERLRDKVTAKTSGQGDNEMKTWAECQYLAWHQDLQKLDESEGGGVPQLILEEMLHGLVLSTAAFNSHELTVMEPNSVI